MSDQERAAKRRASFGRSARLAKETKAKAEREKAEAQRRATREKGDQQRKADAARAAEQRVAQARKKTEQRRLQRHKDDIRAAFSRKAEDRQAQAATAERRQADDKAKAAEQARQAKDIEQRRAAEAYVAKQQARQAADQVKEHRRQTHRLRVEHQAERTGFGHREAGALIQHARQIRNIDIQERRDLEALDTRRHSLTGRAISLVRGTRHYDRQARSIIERHEDARWQKHRDHEARKDGMFEAEQDSRLRQVGDRHEIAQRHQMERGALVAAHARGRPALIEARVQAMGIANENQKPRQQEQSRDIARPAEAFNKAAEHAPDGHGPERGR